MLFDDDEEEKKEAPQQNKNGFLAMMTGAPKPNENTKAKSTNDFAKEMKAAPENT